MARRVMTISANSHLRRQGYTLFEILLALGIVAILLGVTVPMVLDSFSGSGTEDAVRTLEKSIQAARGVAIESGETRRFQVVSRGLVSGVSSIPSAELPKGWELQIQRLGESRFRKPGKTEFWEFNGAGICEPVVFRLSSKDGASTIVRFDPLTGLVIDENE